MCVICSLTVLIEGFKGTWVSCILSSISCSAVHVNLESLVVTLCTVRFNATFLCSLPMQFMSNGSTVCFL
jgi:hypothetical protein